MLQRLRNYPDNLHRIAVVAGDAVDLSPALQSPASLVVLRAPDRASPAIDGCTITPDALGFYALRVEGESGFSRRVDLVVFHPSVLAMRAPSGAAVDRALLQRVAAHSGVTPEAIARSVAVATAPPWGLSDKLFAGFALQDFGG